MDKNAFLKAYKEKNEKKTKKATKFPVPNVAPERPMFKKSTPGDIGIEIEVEGRNLPNRIAEVVNGVSWTVHNDGSLRGGLEYVLSNPCRIGDVPELINNLWQGLTRDGVRLNNSNRTSTHVHVNIQGMKINSLTSYFLLWIVYEQAFIRWCGKARTSNHFCLSNQDCANFLGENWLDSLKNGGFGCPADYRYSALNLNAMTKFNSFEFRCLDGITDPVRVINWIKLLWALREEATGNMKSPAYLVNVLSEMSPFTYLEDIFHRHELDMEFFQQIVAPYQSYREFNSECFTSFRDVQEICFAIDWDNWKEDFEKEFYENPFSNEAFQPAPRPRRRGAIFVDGLGGVEVRHGNEDEVDF